MDKNDTAFSTNSIANANGDFQWGDRGLTAQTYAAIHLKVTSPDLPDWLNEMIDRSRRDDFARAALQGVVTDSNMSMSSIIELTNGLTNAMMEESK